MVTAWIPYSHYVVEYIRMSIQHYMCIFFPRSSRKSNSTKIYHFEGIFEMQIWRRLVFNQNMMICVQISWKCRYSCMQELENEQKKKKKMQCWLQFNSYSNFIFPYFAANSSPKIFGPSHKRIEGLSIVEQNELKGAAWFQAGIPREISLEVLSRQCPGAFLVRQSRTKPGCFALSLRVPPPAPKVLGLTQIYCLNCCFFNFKFNC